MTWVGAVSEKCWQKQTAVSATMENMSSYFKNLGCEEEERDRKKVWSRGGKRRVRGRILFFNMKEI